MRRILLLSLFLFAIVGLFSQQSSVIEDVFIRSVEAKVDSLQQQIGFNDVQAKQLREVELNFLRQVNKAQHCFLCKKKKRIEKLAHKRDAQLQKILERDQYIKYDAIENNKIRKLPLWS